MPSVNELNIDLNDPEVFPPSIYEGTRKIRIKNIKDCRPCNEPLDDYMKRFIHKLFSTLENKGDT